MKKSILFASVLLAFFSTIQAQESLMAGIGIPEGTYHTPTDQAYVPTNIPLTFHDLSTGNPIAWQWSFEGADVAESAEQNPVVTYAQPGNYCVGLKVTDGTGMSGMTSSIQAGGVSDVWNISLFEQSLIQEVTLGWFGSYAGTNWVGMRSFAEHFDAPLAPATIDTVNVYFASVKSATPDALITVSVCKAAADGQPGEVLGSASLPISALVYEKGNVLPTAFPLPEPVAIDEEFFVTISGFPQGNNDNVSVLCAYRGYEAYSTTWHELEDEDAQYHPLGTYTWFKNVDEGISLALTAHLSYGQGASLNSISTELVSPRRFDLQGRCVSHSTGFVIEGGSVLYRRK